VDFIPGPWYEVIIRVNLEEEDTRKMLHALNWNYLPRKVVIFLPTDRDRPDIGGLDPFNLPYKEMMGRQLLMSVRTIPVTSKLPVFGGCFSN